MKTNVKLNESYYLINEEVNSNVTVEVTSKTNHIFMVDVSYSMSGDLHLIRTQLKNKLSNLMKEGDTISIVWFSGKNDAGILKEEVEVKSLKTLSDLNDAIDRWLRPVGLTAFLKPLQLVEDIVGRIRQNRPDSVFSMIFLTDGYNNDCPWNEVTATLKRLENEIASSTFVEYGYYADSRKLTEMAGIVGGEKISCDGFNDFEPVFDKKISMSVRGGKKTMIEISDHLYDFAFSVNDGSILLYNIVDGKIMVGADVKEIHYFASNNKNCTTLINNNSTALYAAVYVLSDKLMNDDAEQIFYALGDNHYYTMLANAFGKQKLNAFKAEIKECVGDETKRFPKGIGEIKPVSDNAFCLMNLIDALSTTDDCLFYPNHKDFNYNKIGRGVEAVGSKLTDADQQRLAEAKDVTEAAKILKEFEDKKLDLKFTNDNYDEGYPIKDLVWNGERANLSVRIRVSGSVKLPKNKFKIDNVASFKYRTYTLIKDGILNVKELPVSYDETLKELLDNNRVAHTIKSVKFSEDLNRTIIVIDLTSIPIINKGMIKGISANKLAELEWELAKIQGANKVFKYYRESWFPKTSKSFADMLGQDCADWLKEVGITDYNGFAPKVTTTESTDFYMSVNLKTKIKGLSSFPKVTDVISKMGKKPLKLNEDIMSESIKFVDDLGKLEEVDDVSGQMMETYLTKKTAKLNLDKRMLMQKIAQIKFSLILSKKWFNEFKTFDENKVSLVLDDKNVDFTFDLTEKEVKI